ncbi:flavodoxin [Pelovirga terrestris]|uniref:Flavodoxin n=1 Tax=Pelovirga terrestris TaxID=2771352 RepID=A0A8J6URE3_9BACT|nr:flavodoxin [Pelovirga terrestris]MBD1401206.1 flavodoxin [Pelovirga terrestris]
MKIGIFYGSTTGKTAAVARQLGQLISTAKLYPVAEATRADFEACDLLILGSSSWCDEQDRLQDDWNDAFECLREANLGGKKVALFGIGDQVGYPDAFVDAIRVLHDAAQAAGAEMIGKWPDEGYNYHQSAASEGDFFLGLPLDVTNQPNLTDSRLASWVAQLVRETNE